MTLLDDDKGDSRLVVGLQLDARLSDRCELKLKEDVITAFHEDTIKDKKKEGGSRGKG